MKKIEIPKKFSPIIKKISETAFENGFETYIVGGFIRDLLLERQPYDLDIMAESKNRKDKDAGMKLAKIISKKYKTIHPVLFKRFGTAKLLIDGEDIEFVMPRKEFYAQNSRNPDTQLADIEQDALRRDFTINALFLRLSDMQILDLTKMGLTDLKNKIIRVTDPGAAEFIFGQDPLRILRAIRQSLQLNFEIENATFDAMKKVSSRISIVSRERIRDEINKILMTDNPSSGFTIMDEIGLLQLLFPDIKKLQNISQPSQFHDDDAYHHTLKVLDRTERNLSIRLSALFHDSGKSETFYKDESGKITFYGHEIQSAKIAKEVLRKLKYSRDEINKVSAIVKYHMRPHAYRDDWSDAAIRRLVVDFGDNLDDILSLAKVDFGKDQPNKYVFDLEKRIEKLKKQELLYPKQTLLDGAALMRHFNLPSGKWIGQAKEKIRQVSLENPNLSKDEALEIVKDAIQNSEFTIHS